MAKSKSTRTPPRKSADDRPSTTAESIAATKKLRKVGAQPARPANGLIQDTAGATVERCRRIIDWLAHIGQPFSDGELQAAEADVLHLVVDALEHSEKVIHHFGASSDAELAAAHG